MNVADKAIEALAGATGEVLKLREALATQNRIIETWRERHGLMRSAAEEATEQLAKLKKRVRDVLGGTEEININNIEAKQLFRDCRAEEPGVTA